MASGWNLWVWLVSVVVRRYIYYRYPHNNYYFPLLQSTCIKTLFFGSIIPISLFIFLKKLYLFMLFFCNVIIKNC